MEWRGGSSLAFTKIAATPYMFDTLAVLKQNQCKRTSSAWFTYQAHCTKNRSDYTQSLAELHLLQKGNAWLPLLLPQCLKKIRGLYGHRTTSYYTCARSCKERRAGEGGYLHKANILRVDTETLPTCVKPIFANHAMTVPAHPAANPNTCTYYPSIHRINSIQSQTRLQYPKKTHLLTKTLARGES
jgi:hypothetical protein